MKESIGVITVVLSIIGLVPYILDVVKRKTQPHLFTWVIWSIATSVVFVGQYISGGGAGSWNTAVTGILTIFITLLAFKFGTKDVTKSDKVYFLISLIAIGLWIITKNPTISVLLVTIIDMFAFFPTIRKSIHNPESETQSTYLINIIRHSLSIVALERYSIVTVVFPAMLVVLNTILSLVIFIGKKKKTFKQP